MLRFAWRRLLANRRRATGTIVAVILGVSIVTGTFVFTDTVDAALRNLYSSASSGATVVVSSRQSSASAASAPATASNSLIVKIRRLPGVRAAQGQVSDTATIVGPGGRTVGHSGLPTYALSYLPRPFTGFALVAGHRPRGPYQVAVDESTAVREGYRLEDSVSVLTGQPVRRFQISGIVKLGSSSLGGSAFVLFDLATARALYTKQGRTDIIYVAAEPGVGSSFLLREIAPLLPSQFVARTALDQAGAAAGRISGQLSLLTGGLLAFGLIAVFVGAFVIFNTFSITVAQRRNEFALLRALGAMRRQVLFSVLAEASLIGLIGSLVGILGGLGAAAAIRALFAATGLNLPSTAVVLEPRTVLIALGVGVLVTAAAGLVPAIRAMRTAPLESLRASLAPPVQPGERWIRPVSAGMLLAAGLIVIFTGSGTFDARLTQSAVGAVPVMLGVVVFTPILVTWLARVFAWPLRRRGATVSRLARENATRNPARTALSASSLTIGLALVVFVTIYVSGLRDSTRRTIHDAFVGDLAIESRDGSSPIPAGATQAAAAVPALLSVSAVKTAPARLGGVADVSAEGVEPTTFGQVYRFKWIHGSSATLSRLQPGDVLVEQDTARTAGLRVGERAALRTGSGLSSTVTVAGIYTDRALLPGVTLTRTQFDRQFNQPRLQAVFVKLQSGASIAAAQSSLQQSLSMFPGVVARSERQLSMQASDRFGSVTILFYALLALSVLMSLLGIVNTLNLSVYERTRELGMLRAMGMTAEQARVMIRDEGVITSAIGALVGVLLGIFVGWLVTRSLSSEGIGFSVGWPVVLAVLAVGLLTGVLASLPPARRVSRLEILAAIAHE